MFKTDTITAIATALSDSGIGIVRVSGDEAFQIVNKIFRNKFGKQSLMNYDTHTSLRRKNGHGHW